MIKERILKRLTRFGLCFYLFSYCMAFTVCAEEYPLIAQDASYEGYTRVVSEAVDDVSQSDVSEADEALKMSEDDRAEGAGSMTKEDAVAGKDARVEGCADDIEEGVLGGEFLSEIVYENRSDDSVATFFKKVMTNFKDQTAHPIVTYKLAHDLELSDVDWEDPAFWGKTSAEWKITDDYQYNSGSLTIDGNGHKIIGSFYSEYDFENCENLAMFSYIPQAVEFRNVTFVDFTDSVFMYDNRSYSYRPKTLTFTNCTFEGNEGDCGGAICVNESVKLTVSNCTFSYNGAESSGGAIAVLHNNSNVVITDSTFEGNYADYYGGAIYDNISSSTDYSYDLKRNIFLENDAYEEGGAIYRERFDRSGRDTVNYCFFLNNTSPSVSAGEMTGSSSKNYYGFISINWFGNGDDNGTVRPDIDSVITEDSDYRWACMRVLRLVDKGSLAFRAGFVSYNTTGANRSFTPDAMNTFPDITLQCEGENIELDEDTAEFSYNKSVKEDYGAQIGADSPDSGVRSYGVTFSDPCDNELFTAEFERGNISVVLNATGTEGNYVSYDGYRGIEQDENMRFAVKEKIPNPLKPRLSYELPLVDEEVQISIDGETYNEITDEEGFFVLNASDIKRTGMVNISISSPVLNGLFSKEYAILTPITSTVISDGEGIITYGDNASMRVYVESDEGVVGGRLQLVYNSSYNNDYFSDDVVMKTWNIAAKDVDERGAFSANVSIKDLEAGNYTFRTIFTPQQSTLGSYYSAKDEIMVLPREVGIRWEDESEYVYNGSLKAPEPIATGMVNGDELKIGTSGVYSDVGNYTARAYILVGNRSRSYVLPANESLICKEYRIVPAAGLKVSVPGLVKYDEDRMAVFTKENMSKLLPDDAKNVVFLEGKPSVVGTSNVTECTIKDDKLSVRLNYCSDGDMVNITFPARSLNYNESEVKVVLSLSSGKIYDNDTDTHSNMTDDIPDPIPVPIPDIKNNTFDYNFTLPGFNGSQVPVMTEPLSIIAADANVTLKIVYADNVTYTGSKYKPKDMKQLSDNVFMVGDMVIVVDFPLLNCSTPQLKFKNIKHATAVTGKQAVFTLKFKPKKGISKEDKARIKAINKVLKKRNFEFTILQADLSNATVESWDMDSKGTKVKKLILTINGIRYTLKGGKNFDFEIGTDSIKVTGKGDYMDVLVIPLKK